MANIELRRSRLFLEKGKFKKVVALFKIQGLYNKNQIRATAVQIRQIAGPPQREVRENYSWQYRDVIEYITENGIEYTIFKVSLKGPFLRSSVKSLMLVNDFTFTITLSGVDDTDVPADVPADDFDPCDFT